MFSKILGKMKNTLSNENQDQIYKISKMNLTDMRTYINNRVPDFPVNEEGLVEVLHKLLEVDEKTSKRYINIDDNSSKVKKGLDLVLSILSNKKVTVVAIELVNEFLEQSTDIIQKYDKENQQIYCTKFKDSIGLAVKNMNAKSDLRKKMTVIG